MLNQNLLHPLEMRQQTPPGRGLNQEIVQVGVHQDTLRMKESDERGQDFCKHPGRGTEAEWQNGELKMSVLNCKPEELLRRAFYGDVKVRVLQIYGRQPIPPLNQGND